MVRSALTYVESDNPGPKNDSSSMKARPAPREMRHNHCMVLRIDRHASMNAPAASPRQMEGPRLGKCRRENMMEEAKVVVG